MTKTERIKKLEASIERLRDEREAQERAGRDSEAYEITVMVRDLVRRLEDTFGM